jgi:hypothetical protein
LNGKERLRAWKTEINGRGDPLRCSRDTLYPQKLTLTSPTCGGGSVRTVCLRTKATEFARSNISESVRASENIVNPSALHPAANFRLYTSDFPPPVFDENSNILLTTITRVSETPGGTYCLSADRS